MEKLLNDLKAAVDLSKSAKSPGTRDFHSRAASALFGCILRSNQQIQKTNRYGTARHRAAYGFIRQAVQIYHGKDIGEY